jgi:hypothetical protein
MLQICSNARAHDAMKRQKSGRVPLSGSSPGKGNGHGAAFQMTIIGSRRRIDK